MSHLHLFYNFKQKSFVTNVSSAHLPPPGGPNLPPSILITIFLTLFLLGEGGGEEKRQSVSAKSFNASGLSFPEGEKA